MQSPPIALIRKEVMVERKNFHVQRYSWYFVLLFCYISIKTCQACCISYKSMSDIFMAKLQTVFQSCFALTALCAVHFFYGPYLRSKGTKSLLSQTLLLNYLLVLFVFYVLHFIYLYSFSIPQILSVKVVMSLRVHVFSDHLNDQKQ